MTDWSPAILGALSEVSVMKDLMQRGYKICIPYGHDSRFDLLAYKKDGAIEKFYRIQVKSALVDKRHKNSVIVRGFTQSFFTINNQRKSKKQDRLYTKEDVDLIAIYYNDSVFYMPIELFHGKKALNFITIRNTSYRQCRSRFLEDFSGDRGLL